MYVPVCRMEQYEGLRQRHTFTDLVAGEVESSQHQASFDDVLEREIESERANDTLTRDLSAGGVVPSDEYINPEEFLSRAETVVGGQLSTNIFNAVAAVIFVDRTAKLGLFVLVAILWAFVVTLPYHHVAWLWNDPMYHFYGTYGTDDHKDAYKRFTAFISTSMVTLVFLYFAHTVSELWREADMTIEEAVIAGMLIMLMFLWVYRFMGAYYYTRRVLNPRNKTQQTRQPSYEAP